MSKIRRKDFKIFGFSDNIFLEKIEKKRFLKGKVLERSFGHFDDILPLRLAIFYPLIVSLNRPILGLFL